MKRTYQIQLKRAIKQLTTEGNRAVQLMLPMAETVGWPRQGVGELIRQAGLQLMHLLMEEEAQPRFHLAW